MKRIQWVSLTAAAVIAVTVLPLPKQFSLADSARSDDIVILYTNDIHCAVDDNIGYDGLALYKRELEAQYEHVFLVDAGDSIQGGPVGTLSEGKDIITLMNAVGYDVCIPGNHEFEFGTDTLLERSKELKCGYISCNITDLTKEEPVFDAYKILKAGDKKIAFVGVTTPETFSKSTPVFFQNEDGVYIYGFKEKDDALYQCVQDSIDAARKENPDYVILLAHLGETDVTKEWSAPEVAAHIKGIDAIIDAHSHEETPALEVKTADGKAIPVTQTGTKLKQIGQLTISADGKLRTELIDSVPEPDKKLNLEEGSWQKTEGSKETYVDTKVHEQIEKINEKLDEQLTKKIGEAPFRLYDSDPETGVRRVRNGETNVGNLCADAYRGVLDADVALLNGGGLRSFIEPGDITYREAMAVMPYGNMICKAKVTGQQILDMLEIGAMSYPNENGSFANVSGMRYSIDPNVESTVRFDDKGRFVEVSGARRVHSVMIGEKPLDPEKTYTLASHDFFLKNGGDSYVFSGKCEILRDSVMSESELLPVYIRDTLDGVIPERYRDPLGEGRITIAKAPETTEPTTEPTETTEPTTEPTDSTTEPVTEPTTASAEPATEATEPTTEPTTAPSEPGFQIPPELLAMLQQQTGLSEEELMKLDWSKLPENPTMEDLQKFLMEQLNPGGEQELGEDGLPEGLDPSMFPEGFDYTKVDWSQFPPGFDWSQIPEDFDWFSLLGEEDNTNGSGPKEEEPMYVVPFLLTPRPPYTPTPVKEIEHHTYDYITTPRDTAGSSSVKHEEKKDTPYTGEHSAAAAAACAALLTLLTAAAVRKKH